MGAVYLERTQNLGGMPGHLFRDTLIKLYDRHAVVDPTTRRNRVYGGEIPSEETRTASETLSTRERAVPKIRRYQSVDVEFRNQAASFDGEPVSNRDYLGDSSDTQGHIIVEERVVYSRGEEEKSPLAQKLQKAIASTEIDEAFSQREAEIARAQRLSDALRAEREGKADHETTGFLS